MTPEEINACHPGDKVRLDGLVLTRSSDGWWRDEDNRARSPYILALPGVTVTKLVDPDLLLARECAAKACEAAGWSLWPAVQSALIAIKAVRGEKP